MVTSTQAGIKRSAFFFLVSFCLLTTIAFILLIASLCFIPGGSLSWWHFPLSFVLAAGCTYMAAGLLVKEERAGYFLKSILVVIVVFFLSIFIASSVYDTSADGLVYHQEAVYQLGNGWNPMHTVLPDSVSQAIWINHYAKGAELPQAAIYSFTHRIEAGKATNIILIAAAFFLSLSVMCRWNILSFKKSILLSALLVLNPVTVNQVFTYYLDGQVASLLVCFLAVCVLLCWDANRFHLLLLASVMIITVNIKFTAVVFVGIFCLGFLLFLLIYKKTPAVKKVFYTMAIAGAAGLLLVGYNPYVLNTRNYHHPFYPLMGKDHIEIIGDSYPIGFAGKGRFGKFFTSYFSHTDNEGSWPWSKRAPSLKIPLTLNKTDILGARTEDTRIAGFGPFFSGILLLSLLFFLVGSRYYPNRSYREKTFYALAIILISVLVIPEAWWARYVPQLWSIPLILLLLIEPIRIKWLRAASRVLYFLIAVNISFSLLSIPYRLLSDAQLGYQLSRLKASGSPVKVQWGNARSNRIRLAESGIPYLEQKIDTTRAVEIVGSDSKIEEPLNMPDVPKPLLLKWWRGIKP
jgi:hypothetical protein